MADHTSESKQEIKDKAIEALQTHGITINSGFSILEALSKVKQREVPCPIIKQTAMTTSLMTIDDISLKTTIASPDTYDLELTKLVYNHVSFPNLEKKPSFNEFTNNISYIDRKALIWGIFASTYGTLGKVNIKCPYCDNEFTDEIKADDLIQPDTFTVWDKPVTFNEYVKTFDYICNLENIYKIEFDISLPSIYQQLNIIKLINSSKLKDNFNKVGNIFSKQEELASVIRQIKIYSKPDNPTVTERVILPKDIYKAVGNLPLEISDAVLNNYSEEFDKFIPQFKKPFVCAQCNNEFDYISDPAVSLFRQFFRSR